MNRAKKNDLARNRFLWLAQELDDRAEEARERAGFHALEAVEMERSPENAEAAADCRERALKLSAAASAYLDVRNLLRVLINDLATSQQVEVAGAPKR